MSCQETLPVPPGSLAPQSRPDSVFLLAGKAEEKTGGRSQLPWRDVYSEIPGRPGPLGSAGGGRGAANSRGRELLTHSGRWPHAVLGSSRGWAVPVFLTWDTAGWAGHGQFPVAHGVLPARLEEPHGAGACRRPPPSAPSSLHLVGELEVLLPGCRGFQN